MYTKKDFGKELKKKVLQKQNISNIGHWAYSVYCDKIGDVDTTFEHILLTLSTMENSVEFAFTYKELEQIADDLIFGKKVNLL